MDGIRPFARDSGAFSRAFIVLGARAVFAGTGAPSRHKNAAPIGVVEHTQVFAARALLLTSCHVGRERMIVLENAQNLVANVSGRRLHLVQPRKPIAVVELIQRKFGKVVVTWLLNEDLFPAVKDPSD